jgi:hypothetical protein
VEVGFTDTGKHLPLPESWEGGRKMRVQFSTFTDSLLLLYTGVLAKTDVYARLSPIMDFSSLSPENEHYSTARQNLLYYWKDETKGERTFNSPPARLMQFKSLPRRRRH